jgi:hypothetical protein
MIKGYSLVQLGMYAGNVIGKICRKELLNRYIQYLCCFWVGFQLLTRVEDVDSWGKSS